MSADTTSETPFEQARRLYRSGDVAQARRVLEAAVTEQPDDVPMRHALGTCLADLRLWAPAEEQLNAVLAAEPRHYPAAYRLGLILQAQHRPAEAAAAYRQALGQRNIPDAWLRLRQCEQPLTDAPDPPGGPVPDQLDDTMPALVASGCLAADVDERGVVDVGAQLASTNTTRRHLCPPVLFALAFAITVWCVGAVTGGATPTGFGFVALLYAWIAWLITTVQSRMNRFVFHQRRVDLNIGVLSPTRQVIWYYQIFQVQFVRTPMNYVTNTASLRIVYYVGNATKTVTAEGIGTAATVMRLYERLQPMVVLERRAMKKILI